MRNRHIDFDTKKLYAIYALDWCKNYFGKSKRKKRDIILKFSKTIERNNRSIYFAKYCFLRNQILIYLNNCPTTLIITQTIIHEYTHYLQSRTMYYNYKKKYSYKNNPYEIEAQKNEKLYGKICLKEIENQFNISKSDISFK
jgi:hypothetical protein